MYIASRCTASKCNKARAQQKDKEDACVVWSKEARQGTTNLPVKFGFWWGLSIANTRGLTALQIVHVRIISTGDELLLWLDYYIFTIDGIVVVFFNRS